jgi:hypothetical protein
MQDDTARKPVSKRLRFEVFRRDGFRCRYCGLNAGETGAGLTIDHVVPVALGGANEPSNLVTACKDCNAGKSSSSPDAHIVSDVADDAVRWARAMKIAIEESQREGEQYEAIVRAFAKHWRGEGGPALPGGWRDSVRSFASSGMSRTDLLRYADTAIGRSGRLAGADAVFRYFCGTCWNVISDRQKRATAALSTEQPQPGLYREADSFTLYSIGSLLRMLGVGRADMDELAELAAEVAGDASDLVNGWRDCPDNWSAPEPIPDLEATLASYAGYSPGLVVA